MLKGVAQAIPEPNEVNEIIARMDPILELGLKDVDFIAAVFARVVDQIDGACQVLLSRELGANPNALVVLLAVLVVFVKAVTGARELGL